MAFLLDVIAPLFLLIGCGYLLGRRRSVDPAPLADVAIYICLPFLMFAALVRHPVTGAAMTFDARLPPDLAEVRRWATAGG